MRTVLDTNTVISALLFGGKPRELFSLGAGGTLSLHTSDALLEELRVVLHRAKFAPRLASTVPPATPATVMQRYLSIVKIVVPEPIERTVPTDADDDAVIATALAADAGLIVTGDSDLLVLDPFRRNTNTQDGGGAGLHPNADTRLTTDKSPTSAFPGRTPRTTAPVRPPSTARRTGTSRSVRPAEHAGPAGAPRRARP